VKLRFKTDVMYDGKLLFAAGKIYDVTQENGWATKWINRGAEIIEEDVVEIQEQKEQTNSIEVTPVKRGRKKKTPDLSKEL
jgi:hypothetical protein